MSERQFSDHDIQLAIAGKDVVVLAMVTGAGAPLATPMWFVNDDTTLAMVSAPGLAKLRHLQTDPRVCVVAEGGTRGTIHGVVLAGAVTFYDGDERALWGERFHAKYMPEIERIWGQETIPDNRVVFGFEPRVVSAFGV